MRDIPGHLYKSWAAIAGSTRKQSLHLFVQQIYTRLKETHSKLQMLEAPLPWLHIPREFTHAALSRREDEAWCCTVTSVIPSPNDEC